MYAIRSYYVSSLYGDNYYHFSCQALLPSKVCLVERNVFDKIIRSNPVFSIEIMRMYSNSLQNVYDKLGSVANKQALGKVCDSLLYLSAKVFESNIIDTTVITSYSIHYTKLYDLAEVTQADIIAIYGAKYLMQMLSEHLKKTGCSTKKQQTHLRKTFCRTDIKQIR